MRACIYLKKTMFYNKIRIAIRKPLTYLYILFMGCYLFSIFKDGVFQKPGEVKNPEMLFYYIVAILTLLSISLNMYSFSKRKGLVFQHCDINFLFTSPVTPKTILLYASVSSLLQSSILSIIIGVYGYHVLKVPFLKILYYLFFDVVIKNCYMAAITVFLYGNEIKNKHVEKVIGWAIKLIIAALVLFLLYYVVIQGNYTKVPQQITRNAAIQSIPLAGWSIAVLELLLVKATPVNIVCSVLYAASFAGILIFVMRMKCIGEYMEDAMKFADDFEEAVERGKKGEAAFFGKRKSYKQADVVYHGTGAKAIFYRQLLEAKKTKGSILGAGTVIHLLIGAIAAYVIWKMETLRLETVLLTLGGVSAYTVFLFSGGATKWQRDLMNPYTQLIPDSVLKKLWYSSIIEHIRAFANGIVLILPGAVAGGVSLFTTLLLVVVFVCFSANSTFAALLAEQLLGDGYGDMAKVLLKIAILSITILTGGVGVIIGSYYGVNIAFILFIVFTLLITFVLAIVEAFLLSRKEK